MAALTESERLALNQMFDIMRQSTNRYFPEVRVGDLLQAASTVSGDFVDAAGDEMSGPLVVNAGGVYTNTITGGFIALNIDTVGSPAVALWSVDRDDDQKWASYVYGNDARFVFLINPSDAEVFSYVPGTTQFEMTGNHTVSGTIRSDGGFTGTSLKIRTGTTMSFLDSSDNTLMTLTDLGTTGRLSTTGDIQSSTFIQAASGATNATGLRVGDGNWGMFNTGSNLVFTGSPGAGRAYRFRSNALGAGADMATISIDEGTTHVGGTAGGFSVGGVTSVKTTDYVATVNDFLIPVNVDTTGDVAITLPAASAAKGQILIIKAVATHATRDININRAGADTINTHTTAGATTMQLSPSATLSAAILVSDGTSAWNCVGHIA